MSEVKDCPFCGEEIKAVAIKCRFCHETLEVKVEVEVEVEKKIDPNSIAAKIAVKYGEEVMNEETQSVDNGKFSSYCLNCDSYMDSKTAVKGSVIIELFLWLCFIVPGIIYSLWRSTSRYKACTICRSGNLIPAKHKN